MDEFVINAEAIICGEAYDVAIVSGPNIDGLCTVDIPFDGGAWVERLAVYSKNIFPRNEDAIRMLMLASA